MKNKNCNIENALERYKLVVEKSSEMIAFADLKGKIIFANHSWAKGHGYKSVKEIIGKNLSIFHPKEELAKIKKVNNILKKNKKWKGEILHKRKDGSVFPTIMDNFILPCCGKKTMVGMAIDIAEVKKYQEQIIKEKETTEKYLQLAGNMIVALDFEGNISLINDAGLKILGYKNDELIGKNWFDTCLPKSYRKEVKGVFAKIVKGNVKPVEKYENPVLTKSGEERIISWFNTILKDKDGRIIGILSSGMDITERKKAEEKLLEIEKKKREKSIQSLLDTAPGFAFIKDKNLNYVGANNTFCDLLKVPYDKIKGKTDYDIFPADLARKYIKDDKIVMKTKKPLLVEETTVDERKGGKRFTVATRKLPWLDEKGRVMGLYGLGFDITELVEARKKEKKYKGIGLLYEISKLLEDKDLDKAVDKIIKIIPNIYDKKKGNHVKIFFNGKDYKTSNFKKTKKHKKFIISSNCEPCCFIDVYYSDKKLDLVIEKFFTEVASRVSQVAQRRFAEKKLKESEEKFKSLVENNPSFITMIDKNYNILFINKVQKGLDIKKVIGSSVFNFVEPAYHKILKNKINYVFKTGKSTSFISEAYGPNNTTLFYENRLGKIKKDGKITGVIFLGLDITEQLKSKEKLKEGEEKYKRLSTNVPGMIYIGYSDWSAEFMKGSKEICGYSEKELNEGKINWTDLIHPDDKDRVLKEGVILAKKQKYLVQNYRIVDKNKKIVWVEDKKTSYFSKDGKFLNIHGIVFDITKRKLIEEKMKESENKFRRLFETSKDGILIIDYTTDKITDANPFLFNLLGYKEDEIIGKEIFELSPIKDIIPNKAKFKELKNRGYARYKNLPLETKKGKKIWVEFISNVYKLDGKVVVQANIRDMTDSKIAQEKLLESEERYKNIFSYSGDASFVMKLDPKKGVIFLECNENTLKLFGAPKKEIIGSNPLKFSPKNQPDGESSLEKIKRIAKLVKKGRSHHFEWEHINYKNKNPFFVDVSLSLIRVKGEELLLAVVKDITEKNKIMEEMDKLASVVKNTTNLVNLSDTSGKMIFINKAGSEMLGIEQKDVGNHNIMEVIPDHLTELVTKELLPKLLDGKMWKGDLQYKNIKTGELVDVNASTFSIKDSKTGKVKYFANTSSNITKRKKIEKDLLQSESRLSATLDSMGDGLFVVDIKGRVTMFNKFASEITGFLPKEVIGKKFRNYIKFVYEDEEKRGDHFIVDSLTQGKTTRLKNHIQIVGKKGLKIPVSSSASPVMDKDGKIIGSVVVFRDITVEKEVDRMKSEFVSLASHQLKTPLTGTRWFTELLLKEKKGKLNKEQKNYLDQIKYSNERLIKLVDDLLDVSHIETGRKFSIEKRNSDIVKIVNESLKEKMDLINRRNIKVVKCKHAPESFNLKIDGRKIRQVFDNLLDNAIKYSKEGSVVEVGCNQEKKDRIIVYIKDGGIGIPVSQQKNIFVKFFRADNAVKTEADGTGLGLYIAKAIILAHGGDMWFESKPGKGSTFYFSLPLN